MIKGSCLCQSVSYQVATSLFDLCHCHCTICQKLTGSSGASYGSAHRSDFTWVQGKEVLSTFSPTEQSRRYFCRQCGAFLLTEHQAEPENVFVSLGTLDSPITEKPEYHQFTASCPDWCELSDTLKKHPGWPV